MVNNGRNKLNDITLPEWDPYAKKFLLEWFTSLMEGLPTLNDDTWPKILELTSQVCDSVHSTPNLFSKIWQKTGNIDDFIEKLNKIENNKIYKKFGENILGVTYIECICPLVKMGLINSPLVCNCSSNFLTESFEEIFKGNIEIVKEKTILEGANACNFKIIIESNKY